MSHSPDPNLRPTPNKSSKEEKESLPPLLGDRAFLGMTATQFLGAFNDNLFKQLVLLICASLVFRGEADRQGTALALFAIPFVLFSGFGGYLSDRLSKRTIFVWCKVAEIGVMGLGMAAFFVGEQRPELLLNLLFVVLFFMSLQSAIFGPAKYGILPEMLRDRDLPAANGLIQMTTFLAIIFGMALAGYSKDWFEGQLWKVSALCVGIAVVGTLTSLLLRPTPVARPGLPFEISSLGVNRSIWQLLKADGKLMAVLLISSMFWFLGGIVQPAVNSMGLTQLGLSDSRTSMMGACMGVGIAIGCLSAGRLSRRVINFRLTTIGCWGMIACLGLMSLIGQRAAPAIENTAAVANQDQDLSESSAADTAADGESADTVPAAKKIAQAQEPLDDLLIPKSFSEFAVRTLLTGLGVAAGFFVVPLAVFMQVRPPEDQKGRMIGAMNLVNWIGILLAAAFWGISEPILKSLEWPTGRIFGILALMLLPVALLYRPANEDL